ncbi:hypothetical protein P7C70_g7344, partial [Phenoliferia sp. Uapishka_3]
MGNHKRCRSESSTSSRLPTALTFLHQLLQLVDGPAEDEPDVRDILFWSENGRYLVICDEADFFERVCRVVFKQSSIANFANVHGFQNKQMNNWRWRRVVPKDVATICEADSSIWNKKARLWEHLTLTRDSTVEEIESVQRHPDGMFKKRLPGGPSPIPRPRPAKSKRAVKRRRRRYESDTDSETEAVETEDEDFWVKDIQVYDEQGKEGAVEAVTKATTPPSAVPIQLETRMSPTPPTAAFNVPRVPHVYFPPPDDDILSEAEESAQRIISRAPRRRALPETSMQQTLATQHLTSSKPFIRVSLPSVPRKLQNPTDIVADSSVPALTSQLQADVWTHISSISKASNKSWDWPYFAPPPTSSAVTPLSTSLPSADVNYFVTSNSSSVPIQNQYLPATLETATSEYFNPSATLLPCLHSTPSTHIDQASNQVFVSPSIAQRRQREKKSLTSLGSTSLRNVGSIILDQNTPTRATFGSAANLFENDGGAKVAMGGARGLAGNGSGLCDGEHIYIQGKHVSDGFFIATENGLQHWPPYFRTNQQ